MKVEYTIALNGTILNPPSFNSFCKYLIESGEFKNGNIGDAYWLYQYWLYQYCLCEIENKEMLDSTK
jgi:hypothetical protein